MDTTYRLKERDPLHDVMHDMITPLTIISTCMQTAERITSDIPVSAMSIDDMDQMKRCISTIYLEIDRLTKFTQSVLEEERMERLALSIDLKPHNLVQHLGCLCDSIQVYAANKGVTMQFTSPTGALPLLYDSEKTERILVNLISNAIKYTAIKETEPRMVHVRLEMKRKKIGVHISDTGIGIPPEQLENIFNRFTRVEPETHSQTAGFGIGLHLALQLTRCMGYELQVASQHGEGTTFSLWIPRRSCRMSLMEREPQFCTLPAQVQREFQMLLSESACSISRNASAP